MVSPAALLKRLSGDILHFKDRSDGHEGELDLADEMQEAPAEHLRRLSADPGGVQEQEPGGYATRRKVGLWFGPLLFLTMLLIPAPAGMGLNVICAVLVTAITYALVIPTFGVVLDTLPVWENLPK